MYIAQQRRRCHTAAAFTSTFVSPAWFFLFFFPWLCPAADAALSQCDMAEELSRQLEDILSTYCRESLSDDASAFPNGQSHSPELNGLSNERENDKAGEGKVNGGGNGAEKEQKKSQEKKKVKGLGKEELSLKRLCIQCAETASFETECNIFFIAF